MCHAYYLSLLKILTKHFFQTHTHTLRLSDKSSKDINSIHLLKTYCLPGAALRTLICSQVLRDELAEVRPQTCPDLWPRLGATFWAIQAGARPWGQADCPQLPQQSRPTLGKSSHVWENSSPLTGSHRRRGGGGQAASHCLLQCVTAELGRQLQTIPKLAVCRLLSSARVEYTKSSLVQAVTKNTSCSLQPAFRK